MIGVPCVTDKLIVSYEGTNIDFKLLDNHLFVAGNSSTGKSFVWGILNKIRSVEEYSHIITFNYSDINRNILSQISSERGKLFVIDNADVILDDDCRDFISTNFCNQYIIFGRKADGLLLSRNNLVGLEFSDNVFTLKYYG